MNRREFSKRIKVAIIKRATKDGVTRCEICGVATARYQVDHLKADGLEVDKSAKLTAADGQLLCLQCHAPKTVDDRKRIDKAKSVEAKHLGAKTPTQPIPQRPKRAKPDPKPSLPPRRLYQDN